MLTNMFGINSGEPLIAGWLTRVMNRLGYFKYYFEEKEANNSLQGYSVATKTKMQVSISFAVHLTELRSNPSSTQPCQHSEQESTCHPS